MTDRMSVCEYHISFSGFGVSNPWKDCIICSNGFAAGAAAVDIILEVDRNPLLAVLMRNAEPILANHPKQHIKANIPYLIVAGRLT